ncbi:DUF6232 family protein [Streptomyces sp. NPDC047974]|uniref:DUF6232 family protein n=1 Tax=Streptomyces sp. NPDC047974 TaxID=3154343 RepID=UPI0033E3340C
MDSNTPPSPPAPRVPSGAPAQPSAAPPPMPPPAPPQPPGTGPVELRVARRLLWIGGAVYPLENVVRVYTFVIRPRRAEAVARFVKRLGIVLLAFLGIGVITALSGSSALLQMASVGLMLALGWFFVEMMLVVGAGSHLTLAIETNGASTALVAGPPEQLHRLVHSIAYAIDHPDAELLERVGSLAISNPSNYYFGDTVNMYGGSGNKGISR